MSVVVAAGFAAACATGTPVSEQTQKSQTAEPARPGSSPPARRNACALVPREQIEDIAKEKVDMLNNVEAEDLMVCEVTSAANDYVLVQVTVYWRGGKELARINQAATGMGKQLLNDDDVDIEELTGSGKVRGLADKAYYSNLMPSWFLKGDVFVEVISPRFRHDQTKAVFVALAKAALPKL